MNAIERMQAQQQKVLDVVEKLGLKEVYNIEFTDYKVKILTSFEELLKVEGAEPRKGLDNETLHINIVVDGVEIGACKQIKKEVS
ncbi:MAG: hypothetical protein GX072_00470 [Lysinibacillus sp.]|nr:hypothetical protein [Lysinibacillus sp.]